MSEDTPMPPPLLVVVSGLPGVGKTTIARGLAAAVGAAYLRIDSIEAGLARSVLAIRPAEDAGYEAAYAVAEDNLRNGRPGRRCAPAPGSRRRRSPDRRRGSCWTRRA